MRANRLTKSSFMKSQEGSKGYKVTINIRDLSGEPFERLPFEGPLQADSVSRGIRRRIRTRVQAEKSNVSFRMVRRVVSFSCMSNSPSIAQPYRCRVSGATGANAYTPTPHGWNKNLQSDSKTMEYTTRHRSRYQLQQPTSTSP